MTGATGKSFMCQSFMCLFCSLIVGLVVYHPFQNHYTHKITIFKLFRSLDLQFSGPTGINFCHSYSFVGLTGICLYSYSSVQLHLKMVFGIIFRKLQLQLHKEMVFELKM